MSTMQYRKRREPQWPRLIFTAGPHSTTLRQATAQTALGVTRVSDWIIEELVVSVQDSADRVRHRDRHRMISEGLKACFARHNLSLPKNIDRCIDALVELPGELESFFVPEGESLFVKIRLPNEWTVDLEWYWEQPDDLTEPTTFFSIYSDGNVLRTGYGSVDQVASEILHWYREEQHSKSCVS